MMQAGKLPLALLTELLNKIDINDPRVALGPQAGVDAALLDFGDRYLVAKTDPITFATDLIGWYVVQVNANDLAVMGATPRWIMVSLMLPEGTSGEMVESAFKQIIAACKAADITLVGGHTEITQGIPRPIAVGAMLGEVAKGKVVRSSGAQVGDAILLTKGIAIEGTALLAREAGDRLRAAGVQETEIDRAKQLLFKPGISVVRDAAIACKAVRVHAMHDPTEGGLATALLEMATASGVGIIVDQAKVPVLPECTSFCKALGLNPLGLIASGALLATVAYNDAPVLIDALSAEGILVSQIGRMLPKEEGLKMKTPQGIEDLPVFERDELARLLSS